MAEVAIGLKNFYMGAVAGDGGMGTDLDPVSYSVIDTPVFEIADGDTTAFNIEESDTPYFSRTSPGAVTFTLSIYGISPEVLQRHFGGTYTPGATSADPGSWTAPAQLPVYERSIVAEHTQGGYLHITRASIAAKPNWKFQKNGLPQIDIVATVLTPTKLNEPAWGFNQAPYVP